MKVIAITGPSGSGKSALSKFLRIAGHVVVDVDGVAKDIRPRLVDKVKEVFGEEYINADNTVKSKELGLLVFSNRQELKKMNEIMFPEIIKEIKWIIKTHKRHETKLLFFDIAALFGSGAEKLFDEIILITASREKRLERLMKFRKIDADLAIKQVDSVVVNNHDLEKCSLTILNEFDEFDEIKKTLFNWIEKLEYW